MDDCSFDCNHRRFQNELIGLLLEHTVVVFEYFVEGSVLASLVFEVFAVEYEAIDL